MNLGLNPLGTGTVTLEEGGTHIVGTQVVVGSGGTGTYNMLGGSLSTGTYLMMGNAATGNGTFKQSGGTLEAKRNSPNHGFYLGFTARRNRTLRNQRRLSIRRRHQSRRAERGSRRWRWIVRNFPNRGRCPDD